MLARLTNPLRSFYQCSTGNEIDRAFPDQDTVRLNEGRGANNGDMVRPMAEARARVEAAFKVINVDENN